MRRREMMAGLAMTGLATAWGGRAAGAQGAGSGRIDVHAHLTPPEYMADPVARKAMTPPSVRWAIDKHLEEMDRAGVATAMLSITNPGVWFGDVAQGRRLSRIVNLYAADLVRSHPGRFGMFVALPLPDIEGSLSELAYGLDQLHADGVGLFTDYGDTWLGDPSFAPVFAELNRRKAVVYVHPAAGTCCRTLLPEIPPSAIEYGTDTTRAIAHMVFTGFAQRYPDIKLIWSHAGGTMPFLIERFEFLEKQPEFAAKLPSGFRGEIRKYYYDTAQSANPVAMRGIAQLVPSSQLVFGSDYPFRGIAEQVTSLQKAGVFSADELRAIERGNAARVLGRPGV